VLQLNILTKGDILMNRELNYEFETCGVILGYVDKKEQHIEITPENYEKAVEDLGISIEAIEMLEDFAEQMKSAIHVELQELHERIDSLECGCGNGS
jgi:hypothetical protein